MSTTIDKALATPSAVLERAESVRMYSSSALHAARHFHFVRSGSSLLALADSLQENPEIPAVAVVGEGGDVLGVIRKDRLFALLGKPFGREVLGKCLVAEFVEEAPRFDAHADLFAVADRMLPGVGGPRSGRGGEYCLLLDELGLFRALLATQDLANYLSRMTQDDIELAGRLQERLLAGGSLEDGDGWRVVAWSRPAKGVGGDFYFTKRLEDGRLFLALCDVSGKGVAASLIVSMVWGMLKMFDFGRGLRELISGLNEAVVETFHMEKYLTGVFLVYDPAERRLLCADMGHSHAVMFRRGSPRSLKGPRGNLPIGVEAEVDPAIYPYLLEPGDGLLVYSDGLTEQENSLATEFSERRLVATAAEALANGESLRDALPAALDAHRGSAGAAATPQQDDMSFLLLSIS